MMIVISVYSLMYLFLAQVGVGGVQRVSRCEFSPGPNRGWMDSGM